MIRKLLVPLLAALMVLAAAGGAMAAVNVSGSALYVLDTTAKDQVTGVEGEGYDYLQLMLSLNSNVNDKVNWRSRFYLKSSTTSWDVVLREAYASVKTDVGDFRFGHWGTNTWNTEVFDTSATSFSRVKGWMGLGYTSPDLGLPGLKFKAAYFPDGQKAGSSITAIDQNDNAVKIEDNAYVATIEYQNNWLTANYNRIETKVRSTTGDSAGYTVNVVSKTPVEGLRAVLYMGQDTVGKEKQIIGVWYRYQALFFRYEIDLNDDFINSAGGNPYGYWLSYTLSNGITLGYRHTDVSGKSSQFRVSMSFR